MSVTTYDHINITSFGSNGLVVNGYNYMSMMIPFLMPEKHLVNGTTHDYGWIMKYEKKDMVRIFKLTFCFDTQSIYEIEQLSD